MKKTADESAYTIVHGAECTPAERYAVEELAGYLKQMTGTAFPVAVEAEAPAGRRIVVGPCDTSRKRLGGKTVDGLAGEEFIIRTHNGDIFLVGGRPRGTLYAVYHFLDNILGVRWWSKDVTFVPEKPVLKIGALDLRSKPVFENRQLFIYCAFDQDWSARNRQNRLYYNTNLINPATDAFITLDEKHGGGILYPMPGQKAFHTFCVYLPREKYFDAHPDWFAEVNGERPENGQPCLTNPEVLDFITEQVRADLRKDPNISIVAVSQYDGSGNQCRCANCRKIDEEEGSPAGSLVRFVNAVAERIGKEWPDVLVETFAYCHTQMAPILTRAHPNVVIRLCSYRRSFSEPFDTPSNAVFFKDLQDWSRMASHVYLWDYTCDFGNYFRPFPNLRVLGPNVRILAHHNARGYMTEGSYNTPAGEFMELRAWVLSRLLWDPFQDDRALIAEFVNGYYGAAGRYIMDYINLIHDAAAKAGCIMYCGGEMEPSPFVNVEVMSKAEELFRKAEAAVAQEPEVLNRVRRAHMPVQCVWAMNRTEWAGEAKAKGLPEPPSALSFIEAFQRQAVMDKVTYGTENKQLEPFLAWLKRIAECPGNFFTSVRASQSCVSKPFHPFDGDMSIAWCAGDCGPQWIQKDLGKPSTVKAIRTAFGTCDTHVNYRIEGSMDEKTWAILVPRKTIRGNETEDVLPAPAGARFVRTTIYFCGSVANPASQTGQGEWVWIRNQKIELA